MEDHCPSSLLNEMASSGFHLHNWTKSPGSRCINPFSEKLQTEAIRVRWFWPEQTWKMLCWCFAESSSSELCKNIMFHPHEKKESSAGRTTCVLSFCGTGGSFKIWKNLLLNTWNAALFVSPAADYFSENCQTRRYRVISDLHSIKGQLTSNNTPPHQLDFVSRLSPKVKLFLLLNSKAGTNWQVFTY